MGHDFFLQLYLSAPGGGSSRSAPLLDLAYLPGRRLARGRRPHCSQSDKWQLGHLPELFLPTRDQAHIARQWPSAGLLG